MSTRPKSRLDGHPDRRFGLMSTACMPEHWFMSLDDARRKCEGQSTESGEQKVVCRRIIADWIRGNWRAAKARRMATAAAAFG
jgi:hypothetical protein